jgi:predicted DCC family thiol-disulfide oxidoreductase YuxK
MIILFDGACGLCDRAVRFVLRRDQHAVFRFAPLQSQSGRAWLEKYGLGPSGADTVVLIEAERAYLRSDAALRIARHLQWPWPLLYAAIIIPRPIRDPIYDFIARRRYQWFGRVEPCAWITPEQRDRFL